MESFHKVPKDQTRRSNTMVIDIPAKVVGNASKRRTRCDEDDGIISGLFSLDEEQPAFSSGEKCKLFNEDYESDVEDGSGELPSSRLVTSDLVRRASLPTGALTYGTSLPVTIPAGKFWPPKDAVDSIEEKRAEDESDDENGGNRNKTVSGKKKLRLFCIKNFCSQSNAALLVVMIQF
ncbi:hypothetical protein AB6A40_011377 [Gnathostoma spinigerum]|uniref:Uncharacterized protein n=1 Tax=Gnathostoma spinigerum TaxID=75299 RepID=A0ABD6EXH1_9BILA